MTEQLIILFGYNNILTKHLYECIYRLLTNHNAQNHSIDVIAVAFVYSRLCYNSGYS